MSDYTKATNFATKDTLTSGDPLKIVKGTEIDTEFTNIETAVNSKVDESSGAMTGGTINSTTIGATTPSTGAFTTLSASSTVSGAGFSTYLASPPAIGGTAPAAGAFTTLSSSGTATLSSTLSYGGVTLTNAVTGTGKMVLDTSPTLVTPVLGTPTSGVLTNCTGVQYNGFKNRILNGAMVIDQRNAGASVTQTTANLYGIDRFQAVGAVTSKFTFQQSSTAPAGFVNSTLITSSAATSVGASDFYVYGQLIEGLNMADLAWGTASAATVTLSFWVRSSLTGTFGGSIQNSDNSRSYPFSYTISVANTYEQKTITIAGDTSGTWLTTSGVGMKVRWSMGAGATVSGTAGAWSGTLYYSATGATSVVGTNGATFYITGVQLEKGSTATSFDYRPYGTELALCQRYFFPFTGGAAGFANGTTVAEVAAVFPVAMRVAPTTLSAATNLQTVNWSGGSINPSSASVSTLNAGVSGASWRFNNYTGLTSGQGLVTTGQSVTATFSAEL